MKKQFSLRQKIIILVAIPAVSFLVRAGQKLNLDWKAYDRADRMTEAVAEIKLINNIISSLQIERSLSLLQVSRQAHRDITEKAKAQRQMTDQDLQQEKSFRQLLDQENPEGILRATQELATIRLRIDRNEANKATILDAYQRIAESLIESIKSHRRTFTADIGPLITSIVLIENAKNGAGQLKAVLSSLASTGQSLNDSRLDDLRNIYSEIRQTFSSPALTLSEGGRESLQKIIKSKAWQDFRKTIATLNGSTSFADQNFDPMAIFSVGNELVDSLSELSNRELDQINQLITAQTSDRLNSMIFSITEVLVNFGLIMVLFIIILRNLFKSIDQLIRSLEQSSNRVHQTSDTLTGISQNLSSGSQQTASALQETASSMSEMNSMVSTTMGKIEGARRSSEEVFSQVEQGQRVIEEMVNSMQAIQDGNNKLNEIQGIMESVSKKTSIINDIVFKTQLLSFNASIEAARAGQQGKGFAVVAEEVGKLAQTSGKAAEEIEQLLSESKSKTKMIVAETKSRVDSGTDIIQRVATMFNDIAVEMRQINEQTQMVADAAKEQSLGISQVTTAVSEIDGTTQSIVSESQNAELAARKLLQQSDELRQVSKNLSRLIYAKYDKITDSTVSNDDSDQSKQTKKTHEQHGGNSEVASESLNFDMSVSDDFSANIGEATTSDSGSKNISADDDSFKPAA